MNPWTALLLFLLAFHALGWYLTGIDVYVFGTGITLAFLIAEFKDWYREVAK